MIHVRAEAVKNSKNVAENNMVLLILAAGFSTRLEPRTLNTPKHLLPIGDRFLIDYFFDSIAETKDIFSRIVLVTNKKYYEQFLKWSKTSGRQVEIISDGVPDKKKKIGAIGDLLFAVKKAKILEDTFVCAPDYILEDFDFKELLEAAKTKNKSFTIAKVENDLNEIKAGSCLLLDDEGKITRFEEKPEKPFSNLYGVPYYYITKSDLPLMEKISFELRDNSGQIVAKLVRDSKIYAFNYDGPVMHMTTEEDYREILKAKGF